jgi:hypothetical protein
MMHIPTHSTHSHSALLHTPAHTLPVCPAMRLWPQRHLLPLLSKRPAVQRRPTVPTVHSYVLLQLNRRPLVRACARAV